MPRSLFSLWPVCRWWCRCAELCPCSGWLYHRAEGLHEEIPLACRGRHHQHQFSWSCPRRGWRRRMGASPSRGNVSSNRPVREMCFCYRTGLKHGCVAGSGPSVHPDQSDTQSSSRPAEAQPSGAASVGSADGGSTSGLLLPAAARPADRQDAPHQHG